MLYDANSTMRMLGYQYPIELLGKGGIAYKDFNNVLDAHRKNKTCSFFEVWLDVFMLGYIYGKRAERSRRKQKL